MKKRQVLITSLGNTLEWFDFGLFIFMAPIIGAKFFPLQESGMATIETLMVFAAGFICRPLGGIIFGHYGDTRGRAKTLRISILMITLSTLFIGILPGYETIGMLAPILFVSIRLAQGISIGGEYSGVMIYLAEAAPPKQRGFITSFAATGANLGFLLATFLLMLLNASFTDATINNWAWRLPFLLAGIPGSIILYYRFKLTETQSFQALKSSHHLAMHPFLAAIKYAPRQLLKIVGITCMSGSFYYVFFGYMPTYLEKYVGIDAQQALFLQSIMLIAMLFLVPLAGRCGDEWSRKKMLMGTTLTVLVTVVPVFYCLFSDSLLVITIVLFFATILSSFDQGNSLIAVVENCPENIRYSGIAFAYNLGNAIFGGTAPLVVTVLTGKVGLLGPAFYLMLMAAISFFAATTLLPNNQAMGFLKKSD